MQSLKTWIIVSAIGAGLLLIIANSAIWVNRYLFDTDRFTTTAVTSITSDSSRQALAAEITDRALADYPKIKNVIEDPVSNFISGLLGTKPAQKVTTKAVTKLQVVLTSPPREQPVVINFEGLKDTLSRLIDLSGRDGETRVDPDKIPNQIVLLEPGTIPNFYHIGVIFGWLSPLLFLAALALLVWPYFKAGSKYLQLLAIQGAIVGIAGLLALAIGPLFKPMVLGHVASPNMRVVVGNLYNAFIAAFNHQALFIAGAGALALIVSGSIYGYQYYKQNQPPKKPEKPARPTKTNRTTKAAA